LGIKSYQKKIAALQKRISSLEQKKEDLVKSLRKQCKHLRIAEFSHDSPPERVCVDCGAKESGWYCGYHVLTMPGDLSYHGEARGIILQAYSRRDLEEFNLPDSLYYVGQSHRNFQGGGIKTYEQLTEL